MPAAVNKLNRKVAVARRHGVENVALALANKVIQYPLYLVYGAERWHLRKYHTTNYKKMAVAFSRDVPGTLDVVADVGCGLGEVVNRVRAGRKLGLDVDPRVIAWAKFLQRFNRSDVDFRAGSLDTLARADVPAVDLLITLGWFHYMTDEWIDEQMRDLLKAKPVRYVMVDEMSYQRGRIQKLFDAIGTRVEQRHDWQDDKLLFLYRCEG
ncbi:class I SAM-dependent methyltransferase [Nonomuraea pusilla]|uniref:class I SAM-dependent methyltransferase n=1 Tax=Nonomuraea pusilla TaxID=46177 RepID=UPI003317AFC7